MTDSSPGEPPAASLDQKVRRRLDDVVRFARVVAHELGGTMLPSRMDAPDLEAHPKWRRMQFQNQTLIDHLRDCKAGLDRFRAGGDDGNPATGFDEWAAVQRPLLASLLTGGTRLELECATEQPDGCDAPWTRGVTTLLLSIDEQPPDGGWQRVVLHFGARDHEDRDAIRVEITPAPVGPLVMPASCLAVWGDGRSAEWDGTSLTLSFENGGGGDCE